MIAFESETQPVATARTGRRLLDAEAREARRRHCAGVLRTADDEALAALAGGLVPLRASSASQVYCTRAAGGASRIVKVHADAAAFARELAAYRVLGHTGWVPRVMRVVPSARLLVLEDIAATEVTDLGELAAALGQLHAAASAQPLVLATLSPGSSVGLLLRGARPAWVVDVAAYRAALELIRRRRTTLHVPVALGALEPAHVRRRADGQLVFIDLETFTPGRPEELDLLALASFGVSTAVTWRDLLARHDPSCDVALAYECLRLVAQAAGGHSPP